jgi:hypothetical protein
MTIMLTRTLLTTAAVALTTAPALAHADVGPQGERLPTTVAETIASRAKAAFGPNSYACSMVDVRAGRLVLAVTSARRVAAATRIQRAALRTADPDLHLHGRVVVVNPRYSYHRQQTIINVLRRGASNHVAVDPPTDEKIVDGGCPQVEIELQADRTAADEAWADRAVAHYGDDRVTVSRVVPIPMTPGPRAADPGVPS